MKPLRRLLAVGAGAVLLALVIGAVAVLNPTPPRLREPYAGAQEPIDTRTGVYEDASGSRWLVAPAVDAGLLRFAVDNWSKPVPIAAGDLASASLHRVIEQPYTLRGLTLHDPVRLEGWLFEPAGTPANGVVILHGSGNSDRGNAWYIYLAHTLASAGHVVLLPDKRGAGRSEGDWRNQPLYTLAGDGAAWLERLRAERGDLDRFGFVGVSQGGIITPQAARLAGADFGVALSSSAVPLRQQLRHEIGNDVRNGGAPELLQPALTWLFSLRTERRQPDFWRCNAGYDMVAHWQDWRGPFFVALGRRDEHDNVPIVASVARLASLDDAAGLAWRVYDGVGHALSDEQGRFAPAFVHDLLAWLDRSLPEGPAQTPTQRPARAKGKQVWLF